MLETANEGTVHSSDTRILYNSMNYNTMQVLRIVVYGE